MLAHCPFCDRASSLLALPLASLWNWVGKSPSGKFAVIEETLMFHHLGNFPRAQNEANLPHSVNRIGSGKFALTYFARFR